MEMQQGTAMPQESTIEWVKWDGKDVAGAEEFVGHSVQVQGGVLLIEVDHGGMSMCLPGWYLIRHDQYVGIMSDRAMARFWIPMVHD